MILLRLYSTALVPAQTSGTAPAPPILKLVVLGSRGSGATGREGSSDAVLGDGGARVIVDAAPGFMARLRSAKLSLVQADIIVLTHLQAGHAGDLPDLVKSRQACVRGPRSALYPQLFSS